MSINARWLGQYELREPLGASGMSEVWKAFDTRLQRIVAIKIVHVNLQEDPNFIARFEREARFIAALHYPNIVQIHDFQVASSETEGTTAYMVMEYVEGQTLAQYIDSTARRGSLPAPEVVVQMFASIGLAVHYAHQHGMIHRDLKPANILLDAHNTSNNPVGEPILTDFGVASLLGASAGTLVSAQPGLSLYVSPEQARGYTGDEHSDIYSLGVILYEMVTGALPFQGSDPVVVMAQHINAAPLPPRQINPQIPPALEAVILRCLAKDPEARFPDALTFASAVAEALNVSVPERLGKPAYSADVVNMPTYVVPSSGVTPFITPTTGSSSPGFVPMRSNPISSPGLTPAQSNPISSPGFVPMRSNPISSPGYTPAQSNPMTPLQMSSPSGIGASASGTPVLTRSITPQPVPPPPPRRQRRGLTIALVILAVLVVAGGSLAAFWLFLRTPTAATTLVGHAFYVSSGQLNDGAQGIADNLQIDLQNIPSPPQGKSYHLWLLADKDTTAKGDLLIPPLVHPPVLLTSNLPVKNNSIDYTYPGDTQHNNLISNTSRLLITLEDAGSTPAQPTTDRANWKYFAELPQEYIPNDPTGLRGLDHIRHLFYNENHLKVLGLYGGLDIWALRNTEKVFEASISARDDFNANGDNYGLMHDLFIGVLDYLDGIANFHVDMPAGTPVTADSTFASVSLLTVDTTKQGNNAFLATDPPGDLDHITLHLSELVKAPDAPPDMRQLAQAIVTAIGNTSKWLQQARTDAKLLFAMNATELAQPAAQSLLEDMATQATYAYIGQLDPTTNKVIPGVLQAHYDMQKLATFDVTTDLPASL